MCDVLDKLLRSKNASKNASKSNDINFSCHTTNEDDVLANVIRCTRACASERGDNLAISDITDKPIDDSINADCCTEGASGVSEAISSGIGLGPPARFTADSTITLIYGPPKRGKSYLLKKMYAEPPRDQAGKQLVDAVTIFTPSPENWNDCAASRDVIEWSEKNLAYVMKYQRTCKTGCKNHVALIMDDLLSRINFDTKIMTELFTRHRHYNISIVLTAQNVSKTIHPLVRGQVKRFICFDPPSLESCRILHKAFCASIWPSQKKMYSSVKAMNMMESHSYLVVNVNSGEIYIIVVKKRIILSFFLFFNIYIYIYISFFIRV